MTISRSSVVAEQLRGAAEVIRQYGWVQGEMGDEEKGFCVMGAISRATAPASSPEWAFEFFRRAVGCRGGFISVWNDLGGRKPEAVLKGLERAAKLAEKMP
jgi:hypothetical protein